MQHPLVNPTLTPYDFVAQHRLRRAKQKVKHVGRAGVNGEHEILKLWSRVNRFQEEKPLPAEEIIHSIAPGLRTINQMQGVGDFVFYGKPYFQRDIFVLTSTIAWFGTNVGMAFLTDPPRCRFTQQNRYIAKFIEEDSGNGYRKDLAAFLVHNECKNCQTEKFCRYDSADASERDRSLIHALMYWLGTDRGQVFITRYRETVRHLREVRDKEYFAQHRLRRAKQT